jgi:hypothetical protein
MNDPSLTQAFVEHGAIGLLALLEMFAIIALWRKLSTSQEARIEEAKASIKVAEQARDAMDRLTDALTQRRRIT